MTLEFDRNYRLLHQTYAAEGNDVESIAPSALSNDVLAVTVVNLYHHQHNTQLCSPIMVAKLETHLYESCKFNKITDKTLLNKK